MKLRVGALLVLSWSLGINLAHASWASLNTLGTGQSKTGTTVNITTSSAAEVGNVILVGVASDNNGTADTDAGTETSVADSAGNSYTKIRERVNGSPGAGAGAVSALFFTTVTTQLPQNGTITVTVTMAGAKAATAWEFSIGAGNVVTVEAQATGSPEENTAAPSATISGQPAEERLWAACTAVEGSTTDTFTEDSAPYTSMERSGTTGGGAASNMTVNGAFRIQSVASDTYNPTLGTSRDLAQVFAVLKEAAPGAGPAPALFTRSLTGAGL